MKSQSSAAGTLGVLQLVLAVFFITTGLMYLINYNTSGAQFGRALSELFGRNEQNVLQLVTAILELIAGALLLTGLFGIIPQRLMYIAAFAILVLWGIQMVLVHFADDFLKPELLPWLQTFSLDAVVLAGLWGCTARYA